MPRFGIRSCENDTRPEKSSLTSAQNPLKINERGINY